MARSRNIKPGFFVNADLVELPALTRLLFIGLWTLADREGRLEDRPSQIKMQVLPGDDINTGLALDSLHAKKFITRYSIEGKAYIQINKFKKHQNPHIKEPASIIPPPMERADIVMGNTGNIPASCKHRACLVLAGLIPDSLLLIPDSGFLIPDIPIEPLSPAKPADPPALKRSGDSIPLYQGIIEAFNKFCPSFSKCLQLTEPRRQAIRSRWVEHEKIDGGPLAFFDTLFKKAEASDFISGRSGKWEGKRGIDWVLNKSNVVKIMEGNYDNGKQVPVTPIKSDDQFKAELRAKGLSV